MSEWTEWAKQFEAGGRTLHVGGGCFRERPATCLYARREGPHKVACNAPADRRSLDDYPACIRHEGTMMREMWKGFIEGA